MTKPGDGTFRIPCPNGHVHRARDAWIGRQMICPECNAAFVVRATDSVEFAEQRRRQQLEAESKQATAWITWAIVAGGLVVSSLVAMAVASMNPQWFQSRP